jgi:glutamyl-tRNA synthetase
LKEGIVNFLGLMGYSFGENKEIFFLDEFKEQFNIDHVSLGGPVFDLIKLGWVNNQHMRLKDLDELTKLSIPFFQKTGYTEKSVSEKEYITLKKIVEILREGAPTLKALVENARQFFDDDIVLQEITEDMNSKQKKSVEKLRNSIMDEIGKTSITVFTEKLKNCPQDTFTIEEAQELLHATWEAVETESAGKVYMPLRAVITGQAIGTDLYNILYVIGRDRTLQRIERMIKKYHIL